MMIITYSWLDQYKIIGLNDLSTYFQNLSTEIIKYSFKVDVRQTFRVDARQEFKADKRANFRYDDIMNF